MTNLGKLHRLVVRAVHQFDQSVNQGGLGDLGGGCLGRFGTGMLLLVLVLRGQQHGRQNHLVPLTMHTKQFHFV